MCGHCDARMAPDAVPNGIVTYTSHLRPRFDKWACVPCS